MRTVLAGWLLVVVGLAAAQPPKEAPTDLSVEEKLYGLSVLWKEVSDHFVFFDRVPKVDWDKEYRQAIPKVIATKTTSEYYGVLSGLLGLLKDSHTDIMQWPRVPADPKAKVLL